MRVIFPSIADNTHIYKSNITPLKFFYLIQILTNLPLDYIIFKYSLYLQNFKTIKNQ